MTTTTTKTTTTPTTNDMNVYYLCCVFASFVSTLPTHICHQILLPTDAFMLCNSVPAGMPQDCAPVEKKCHIKLNAPHSIRPLDAFSMESALFGCFAHCVFLWLCEMPSVRICVCVCTHKVHPAAAAASRREFHYADFA